MARFSNLKAVFGTSNKAVSVASKEDVASLQNTIIEMQRHHASLESQVSELVKRVDNPNLYCGDCENRHCQFKSVLYFGVTTEDKCMALNTNDGHKGRLLIQGHFGVLRDPNCPGYVPPVQPVAGDPDKPESKGKR